MIDNSNIKSKEKALLIGVIHGELDEKIVKALRKKVNIATQVMGEELKAWI